MKINDRKRKFSLLISSLLDNDDLGGQNFSSEKMQDIFAQSGLVLTGLMLTLFRLLNALICGNNQALC